MPRMDPIPIPNYLRTNCGRKEKCILKTRKSLAVKRRRMGIGNFHWQSGWQTSYTQSYSSFVLGWKQHMGGRFTWGASGTTQQRIQNQISKRYLEISLDAMAGAWCNSHQILKLIATAPDDDEEGKIDKILCDNLSEKEQARCNDFGDAWETEERGTSSTACPSTSSITSTARPGTSSITPARRFNINDNYSNGIDFLI